MIEKLLKDLESKMKYSIDHIKKELRGIRTGRASISLLDGIVVDYYGTVTHLNKIASVSVSESQSLSIQPWDISILPKIEKAIMASDLGLTPANDGKLIRINIPPLNEERRKQLVKHIKKVAEDTKIAIRNIRRDGIEQIKSQEKDKQFSKDLAHSYQDKIQRLTDRYISQVDNIFGSKEKEILEV